MFQIILIPIHESKTYHNPYIKRHGKSVHREWKDVKIITSRNPIGKDLKLRPVNLLRQVMGWEWHIKPASISDTVSDIDRCLTHTVWSIHQHRACHKCPECYFTIEIVRLTFTLSHLKNDRDVSAYSRLTQHVSSFTSQWFLGWGKV